MSPTGASSPAGTPGSLSAAGLSEPPSAPGSSGRSSGAGWSGRRLRCCSGCSAISWFLPAQRRRALMLGARSARSRAVDSGQRVNKNRGGFGFRCRMEELASRVAG